MGRSEIIKISGDNNSYSDQDIVGENETIPPLSGDLWNDNDKEERGPVKLTTVFTIGVSGGFLLNLLTPKKTGSDYKLRSCGFGDFENKKKVMIYTIKYVPRIKYKDPW